MANSYHCTYYIFWVDSGFCINGVLIALDLQNWRFIDVTVFDGEDLTEQSFFAEKTYPLDMA